MSQAPSRGLSTAQALEALHSKLDERAAEAYWQALSRFLRFELTKEEFDRMASTAIGPNAALHNAVIMALVNDAQTPNAAGEVDAGHPFALHHIFQAKTSGGDSAQHMGGSASASDGTSSAAQTSAPKLMLKISRDGSATAQRPDLVVDPLEEAQLNALHDRMIDLAKQHGLQGVQPEAVSFMHRAVRVVSNRLLASAALSSGKSTFPPDASDTGCSIKADDLHDAIRLPVPAPWMAPPSQRAGSTLGAFNKFVS